MGESDPSEPAGVGDRTPMIAAREDGTAVDEKPRHQQEAFTPAPSPRYRFIAGLLIFTGSVVVTFSWHYTAEQQFLITVGSISMFGGLLMYYLSNRRFVSARVPNQVYQAMAENQAALVDAVEYTDTPVYIPTADSATLYVPRGPTDLIPKLESVTAPEVSPDAGTGLAFVPTGAPLFKDFERSVVGPIAEDPSVLATQLEEGLVDTLELARSTELQLDPDNGRIDIAITGSIFPDGFDTPTASFLAVGLAHGLETAIVTEITPDEDNTYTVTCHWNPDRVGTAE